MLFLLIVLSGSRIRAHETRTKDDIAVASCFLEFATELVSYVLLLLCVNHWVKFQYEWSL